MESGSATVRRLMFSFERFYKSMIRLGDDFDKMFRRFNGMKFENVDDEHAMMDEEAGRMKNGVVESHINAEKPPSRKSSHVSHEFRQHKLKSLKFLIIGHIYTDF